MTHLDERGFHPRPLVTDLSQNRIDGASLSLMRMAGDAHVCVIKLCEQYSYNVLLTRRRKMCRYLIFLVLC